MGITDDPNNPCLKNIKPDGQQACYLVLSDEERAKGFVRPVRRSYQHVGQEVCGHYRPSLSGMLGGMQEVCCMPIGHEGEHFIVLTRLEQPLAAVAEKEHRIGGCGAVTTMGQAIAETYARNPSFYGGTFCVQCGKHFPVGASGEFIWIDDGTRVGT